MRTPALAALLILPFAAFATEAGDRLRTDAWGQVWAENEYMEDWVDAAHTPGNTNFVGWRVTAPAYYAFLDGYDTRAFAFDDDEIEANTNVVTHRFAYYADLKERIGKLANLKCGTNDGYSVKWSSSHFEGFGTNDLPSVEAFDWTTNVLGNVYGTGLLRYKTRWLPAFDAMAYDAETVYKASVRPLRGAFWHFILPAISVDDPAVHDFLRGSESEPSLPSFDALYAHVYGDAPTLSNRTFSARLVVPKIAQADRALSLFDRTIGIEPDVTAYTNTVSATGNAKFWQRATLPTLYIEIDDYGTATIDATRTPPRISTVGSIVSTNYVDATNWPCALSSPRLRVGRPTLAATASFSVETNAISATLEGDAFRDFCDVLYSDGYLYEKQISFTASINLDGNITLDALATWVDEIYDVTNTIHNATRLRFSKYQSGEFPVNEGRVAIGASYGYGMTTPPRLPYGVENWPVHTDNADSFREFAFASFISTNEYHGWSTPVTYGSGAEFGYKSFIDSRGPDELRFTMMSEALTNIEEKVALGDAADPVAWTGLRSGYLSTAVQNYNAAAADNISARVKTLVIGDEEFWSGNGTISRNSYNDQYSIVTQDGTVYDSYVPVATRTLLLDVTLPTTGITIRDTAKSVDTRIKCATEANWDFPQLTTRAADE